MFEPGLIDDALRIVRGAMPLTPSNAGRCSTSAWSRRRCAPCSPTPTTWPKAPERRPWPVPCTSARVGPIARSASDEAPIPAPGPKPGATCIDTIALNHGHVLTIASAELDSPTDMDYNIQGGAAHNHTVTLAVANLRALKAGTAVTVGSSNAAGHEHSVSITCL